MKSGPRSAFRPSVPNWQFAGLLPPTQAPVLGSTAETNANGLSHWTVPGCVIPAMELCSYSGTPGTTLANCGPLPFTIPSPLAEYGVLKTENGSPVCQNAVPETCHLLTAYPRDLFLTFTGN